MSQSGGTPVCVCVSLHKQNEIPTIILHCTFVTSVLEELSPINPSETLHG